MQSAQLTPATTLEGYLDAAVAAARLAAAVIREGATTRATLVVERKNTNDFVSAVDRRAEGAIIDHLATRYPDHAIMSGVTKDSLKAMAEWKYN